MLQARSVYELGECGATSDDLLHWASCLADELGNATRDNKSFVLKKLHFCQAFVQMHQGLLDKDVRNLGNMRSSLAESYFTLGEAQKGDALFKKWLEFEPDWGWGWIHWSDCFWLMKYPGVDIDFNQVNTNAIPLNYSSKVNFSQCTDNWNDSYIISGKTDTTNRFDIGDRAQLRAEIDAIVAHLYGLNHDEMSYILDTFTALRNGEEREFGEFKSKRMVLEEMKRLEECQNA